MKRATAKTLQPGDVVERLSIYADAPVPGVVRFVDRKFCHILFAARALTMNYSNMAGVRFPPVRAPERMES